MVIETRLNKRRLVWSDIAKYVTVQMLSNEQLRRRVALALFCPQEFVCAFVTSQYRLEPVAVLCGVFCVVVLLCYDKFREHGVFV